LGATTIQARQDYNYRIDMNNNPERMPNMALRKKVSILGFMIGSIVDIVGTNIWAIFVTIYVLVSYNLLQSAVSSPTAATEKVLTIFQTDPAIFSANFIAGSLFLVIGGYVGAFIAKHDELLNGALSSFFCVLLGVYGIFNSSNSTPILLQLLLLIVSPLLAMSGGYLRLKQKSRTQIVAPA
jgi:hypothetical protein